MKIKKIHIARSFLILFVVAIAGVLVYVTLITKTFWSLIIAIAIVAGLAWSVHQIVENQAQ